MALSFNLIDDAIATLRAIAAMGNLDKTRLSCGICGRSYVLPTAWCHKRCLTDLLNELDARGCEAVDHNLLLAANSELIKWNIVDRTLFEIVERVPVEMLMRMLYYPRLIALFNPYNYIVARVPVRDEFPNPYYIFSHLCFEDFMHSEFGLDSKMLLALSTCGMDELWRAIGLRYVSFVEDIARVLLDTSREYGSIHTGILNGTLEMDWDSLLIEFEFRRDTTPHIEPVSGDVFTDDEILTISEHLESVLSALLRKLARYEERYNVSIRSMRYDDQYMVIEFIQFHREGPPTRSRIMISNDPSCSPTIFDVPLLA